MTVNLPPPCLGQSPRCGVTWMGNWGEMGSLLGWAAVFFWGGGRGSVLFGSIPTTTWRTGIHMLTKLGVHFLQVAQAPTSCLCFTSVKPISKCEK